MLTWNQFAAKSDIKTEDGRSFILLQILLHKRSFSSKEEGAKTSSLDLGNDEKWHVIANIKLPLLEPEDSELLKASLTLSEDKTTWSVDPFVLDAVPGVDILEQSLLEERNITASSFVETVEKLVHEFEESVIRSAQQQVALSKLDGAWDLL